MDILEDRDISKIPSIPEFFNGKTVFITGGSGFMGKVLIEKLLYSCPDLKRIYLLLRSKKGVQSDDRLEQIYSFECFDRLRQEKPDIFKSKVYSVNGDVTELGLGLSIEDRRLLVDEVNIIFHAAASVRFNDPMKYAVKMNLHGTKEIVQLTKEIKNVLVLVHVSTSYSNTNREVLEEVMYPPHADWRDTLAIAENCDDHTINVMTAKYLGELPNTYTFTKQLGEHVVYEQKGLLPCVIFRPSIDWTPWPKFDQKEIIMFFFIVISSFLEPMPGWIDNFNGPIGLLVASGKGVMRSIYSDSNIFADYVPVDIAIKAMIICSWLRGTKALEPKDDIPIYNCCSSKIYKVTLGDLTDMGRDLAKEHPMSELLWYPDGNITKSQTVHYIKVLLFHLLPAILVDSLLWILGKKTLLVKIQRMIYTANLALHYYITQQWTFDNTNMLKAFEAVKDEDKDSFYQNMYNIDIYKFYQQAYSGIRKYLLKEEDDLPKAKSRMQRLYFLHLFVKYGFWSCVIWWFYNTDFCQYIIQCVGDFLIT